MVKELNKILKISVDLSELMLKNSSTSTQDIRSVSNFDKDDFAQILHL